MSDFSDLSKAIMAQTHLQEEQRKAWEEKMGEPDHFKPCSDQEMAAQGIGIGFWNTLEGVMIVDRYANGYNPASARLYDHEFLDILNHVRR